MQQCVAILSRLEHIGMKYCQLQICTDLGVFHVDAIIKTALYVCLAWLSYKTF
jgi:hypothetical protein